MARGELGWWRVEVGVDGKGTDIKAVDRREKDGVQVFYVQARDAKHAGRLAFNAYSAARMAKKRAEWAKAGLCTKCGRKRDADGKWCATCLEKKVAENARKGARRRGEDVPTPTRLESLERRREDDRVTARLDVLEELDDIWSKRGTVGLRQWLRKELARLRQRQVA